MAPHKREKSKKKSSRDRSGGSSSSKSDKLQFNHDSSSGSNIIPTSSGGSTHPPYGVHERSVETPKVSKSDKYGHEKVSKRSKSLPTRKDRDRSSSRPSSSNHASSKDSGSTPASAFLSSITPSAPCRHLVPPPLDPIRLARGMSARSVGARISHHLHILSADEIDKDLRHMEAHRSACLQYAQQFFAFKNHELARNGHYGRYGGIHGDTKPGDMAGYGEGDSEDVGEDEVLASIGRRGSDGGDGSRRADLAPVQSSFAAGSQNTPPPFALPVKIDPEEEKRLLQLRKKIAVSESQREQLEIEYFSLSTHYIHESRLVRKTQAYETGRLKLLFEALERKGKLLALSRVRVAMARDVAASLKYREEIIKKGMRPPIATGPGAGKKSVQTFFSGASADLLELWNDVENQYKEAELACMELETPSELKQIVGSEDNQKSSKGSRSPIRKSDEAESSSTGSKKKAVRNGGINGSSGKGGGSTADESSTTATSSSDNKKNGITSGGSERHVIPWESMVQPRTPFDLPLLLSCLSTAPDKTVGYLTEKKNPTAVTWIEANLPESEAAFDEDADELIKLREEERLLSQDLYRETERNSELQSKIISTRKRSDEMVAVMQLLRSETEAVLERHNIILESPEAREQAAELHRLSEEGQLAASGEEDEEDEVEEEDDEVRLDDEEEDRELEEHEHLHDDEENEDDFSQGYDESAEEGEIQEDDEEENDGDDEGDDLEDEENPVNITEVIVNPDENDVVNGDSDDEDEDDVNQAEDEEEGEIIEEDDAEEGEIEENGAIDESEETSAKRGLGDEEGSNLSPPNSSGFKKRRRT